MHFPVNAGVLRTVRYSKDKAESIMVKVLKFLLCSRKEVRVRDTVSL